MAKKNNKKNETVTAADVATVAAPVINRDNLKAIVEATLDNARGFVYTPKSVHETLETAGLVEVNRSEGFTNEAGEIATRATTKGIEFMSNPETTNAAPATPAATTAPAATKPVFEIKKNIPVPTVERGGRGGDIYPFDALEKGDCFDVPATDERPNPAKSMASTVASATARYAVKDGDKTRTTKKGNVVPVMIEQRKFIVRSIKEGKKIIGARIWRTK